MASGVRVDDGLKLVDGGETKKSRRARGMNVEVVEFAGAKAQDKKTSAATRRDKTDGRTGVGGGRWTLDNGGLRRWRSEALSVGRHVSLPGLRRWQARPTKTWTQSTARLQG